MSQNVHPASTPRWQILTALAAVYIIWGSTYLGIRFAIETLPPFLMAGARFLIAGGLLYGWTTFRGTPRPQAVHWRSALIVGTLVLQFKSQKVKKDKEKDLLKDWQQVLVEVLHNLALEWELKHQVVHHKFLLLREV